MFYVASRRPLDNTFGYRSMTMQPSATLFPVHTRCDIIMLPEAAASGSSHALFMDLSDLCSAYTSIDGRLIYSQNRAEREN